MSKDLNQCNFIGRLGKAPEIKYTAGGSAIANFNLACGDDYKDKQGQKVEQTNWIRVVAFGKLAEIIAEWVKKGSQIYISGKQVTRKWQDQSGNDRYTTEIVANEMLMLGGRSNQDPVPCGMSTSTGSNLSTKPAALPSGEGDKFDDIPF